MTDGEREEGAAPEKELSFDEILGSSLSDSYDAAQALPDDAGAAADKPARDDNRDDKGRFTAQQKAADEAAAAGKADPAAAQNKPNPDQGQTTTAAPGADPASEPPASWSAAEKAIWPTLPPDARAIIARREADFAAGIAQKAQGSKAYEALESVIGPRRKALAATYGSAENAVAQLFKLSDFAEEQPAEFAKWFLQQRGLDPRQIFADANPDAGQKQQPGAAQGQPPEIAAVLSEVAQLKQDLVRAVNEPIVRKAQSELAEFEKDPANVHYTAVKADMAHILQNSGDDSMTYKQAYDAACWANPTIRAQLLESERKAAIEASSKASAEAAAKAKSAAGVRFSSSGAANGARPGPRSIDQSLSEAYDRAQGAA